VINFIPKRTISDASLKKNFNEKPTAKDLEEEGSWRFVV